jgi:hypothetical protein
MVLENDRSAASTATGCPYYLLEGQVMSGCGTNIPAVSLVP